MRIPIQRMTFTHMLLPQAAHGNGSISENHTAFHPSGIHARLAASTPEHTEAYFIFSLHSMLFLFHPLPIFVFVFQNTAGGAVDEFANIFGHFSFSIHQFSDFRGKIFFPAIPGTFAPAESGGFQG